MKKITREMVNWTVTAEPEMEGPEGFFASGDDDQDRKDCENIQRELEAGNDWAWCMVRVEGTFEGLRADTVLGGCNYDSRKQFIEPGGYYDDMVTEVLEELNKQAAGVVSALA